MKVDSPIRTKKFDISQGSETSHATINARKSKSRPSYDISLFIQTATRDGRILVKFSSPIMDDIPKIIEAIDDESLRIEIKTQGNKRVAYNVT